MKRILCDCKEGDVFDYLFFGVGVLFINKNYIFLHCCSFSLGKAENIKIGKEAQMNENRITFCIFLFCSVLFHFVFAINFYHLSFIVNHFINNTFKFSQEKAKNHLHIPFQ